MDPSGAMEFGLITVLRSGDALQDLMMCTAIPLVLGHVRNAPTNLPPAIASSKEWLRDLLGGRRYVTHKVELIEQHCGARRVVNDSDECLDLNPLLLRALALYITEHVQLSGYSARYDVLERAGDLLDDASETDALTHGRTQLKASNEPIAKLGIGALPMEGVWIPLEDGIEFCYQQKNSKPKKNENFRVTQEAYLFRTRAFNGPERIQALMDRAFAYYVDTEQRKITMDSARYMYVRDLDPTRDSDEEAVTHRRFKLGEDKTFASLFFEGKSQLLALLEQFESRSGKFAIPGFPYKLGLLLHGPPGTGKTSLIKALAQRTRRHVVTINLAQVQTNQELMDLVFDMRFNVRELDLPVKLTFKDVIFVMEDIDCASSVVTSRGRNHKPASSSSAPGGTPHSDASGSEDDSKSEHESVSDDEDEQQPAFRQELLAALLGDRVTGKGHGFVSSSNSGDKLNLAGLLNVLDGVIDCPGRIVVMTTNHFEKLDPALVRPGRVNKKLLMGFMEPEQAALMLEYYFATTLTAAQRARLLATIAHREMTPAQVEELCAEYDHIDDVLDTLEKSGRESL